MTVTATHLPDAADERQWYCLRGMDPGTGVVFANDDVALCPDGTIADTNGEPMVNSDWETIAVRNSIPPREVEPCH